MLFYELYPINTPFKEVEDRVDRLLIMSTNPKRKAFCPFNIITSSKAMGGDLRSKQAFKIKALASLALVHGLIFSLWGNGVVYM